MDKKEIKINNNIIKEEKEVKEIISQDEIYTEEEAKKILEMLKKKKPRIKD